MKKFTLTFTMMIAMLFTQAQEVSTDQWTIMTKTSATWCGNCGSWGWDLFKDLIEDNSNKNVIIWSSHNSGDLDNAASIDINTGWGSFAQPQFFVNSDNFNVTSNNTQAARVEINGYIDALVGFGAFAGVGVDATYDGETLSVTGKAEFFTGLEDGDYHLAFYLLKDHVIANQASVGPNADHRYVLADKITESSFGEQIVEGTVTSGATYTVEASKEMADIDLDNDEVVAILWNLRADGVYAFFNANRNMISSTSATVEVDGIFDLSTRQNGNEVILDIRTQSNLGFVQSRLVNVHGQIVATQDINVIDGSNQIRYNTNNLSAGTYLVQITANGKIHSEKVIII